MNTAESVIWRVPLGERPTVVQMGIGVHGVRASVERFRLEGLWSLHAYGYAAGLRVGGHEFAVTPGTIGVVPPGEATEYRFAGRCEHVYAHFALPPAGGSGAATAALVPALTPPGGGPDSGRFAADLREALTWLPAQPRRAEARLWDLLWRLAAPEPEGVDAAALHPAVRLALSLIESRLAEGVRVSEIAREAGVSPGHLTRLFRAATGRTVIDALQERRAERARHLLTYSDLPVKAVAAQVGIEDLNLFNKTVRRRCGASPRAIRAQGFGRQARVSPEHE
jgi:AraC-like DNA-binding protein